MKMIVGLGNPGKEYEHTRHNAGFDVVDKICEELGVACKQAKMKALLGEARINQEKVLLVKPQTYMNISGEAVQLIAGFYKIEPSDILVIFDDMDLPVGQIRLRKQGSSGGQKGMKHIMNVLSTQEIDRIRIGIGKDERIPVVDYVLGKVKKEEKAAYEEALTHASKAAIHWANHTMDETMNEFNKR